MASEDGRRERTRPAVGGGIWGGVSLVLFVCRRRGCSQRLRLARLDALLVHWRACLAKEAAEKGALSCFTAPGQRLTREREVTGLLCDMRGNALWLVSALVACGGTVESVGSHLDAGNVTDKGSQPVPMTDAANGSLEAAADMTNTSEAAGAVASEMSATDGALAEVGPAVGSVSEAGPAAGTPGHWVMGYYSAYDASSYPIAEIDWAGLTDLAVAFYLPTMSGQIDLSASGGQAVGQALVAAAHNVGKKAIASFGGSNSQPLWQGATANRAVFVDSIVSLLQSYGYDGVDLDWEPFDTGDHPALLALAKDLRAALPATLITMPVGCENNNSPDDLSFYSTLAPLVDRINLMSYGLSGAWPGWKSWHSSPLHWNGDTSTPIAIDSSVEDYLKAGVPATKLGIGSGFFGECYSAPVTAPDQPLEGATVVASDGTMSYANIMADYATAGARKWDTGAMVPYLSFGAAQGAQNCTYVTYEDEQSISAKGEYLKQTGLGGVIIWTINEGYVASATEGQRSPLLEAMKTAVLE